MGGLPSPPPPGLYIEIWQLNFWWLLEPDCVINVGGLSTGRGVG